MIFNTLNCKILMLEEEQKLISEWYRQHHRRLPWRETRNPYHIWVSEIILQQTRVKQGLSYYQNFIERFPTIRSLAEAEEDDILHLWQGLGYYSRARNMHAAAKEIMGKHNGEFPNEYDKIRMLKGIGDYTAAAIASFAFDLPYPAVDGNVMRVICRLKGIKEDIGKGKTQKMLRQIAKEMMPADNPALFNQSMMEFGAMQCTAQSPECGICPVQEYCFAFRNGLVNQLPLKIKKTKVRSRWFYYLVFEKNAHVWIKKRRENDIWKNLYDFPLIESDKALHENELAEQIHKQFDLEKNIRILYQSEEIKHQLSHQLLHIRFYIIPNHSQTSPDKWERTKVAELHKYAFPEIINKHRNMIEEQIDRYENH